MIKPNPSIVFTIYNRIDILPSFFILLVLLRLGKKRIIINGNKTIRKPIQTEIKPTKDVRHFAVEL